METGFNTFVAEAPILKKLKKNEVIDPFRDFNNLPFNYFCKHDKKETTFLLGIKYVDDYNKFSSESQRLKFVPVKNVFTVGTLDVEENKNVLNKVDVTIIYEAVCQLCKKTKIEIVLKIYNELDNGSEVFFVQKIAHFPPIIAISNKETYNFLRKEDQFYYEKARQCLISNFGMGAYAYYRRIIENEIKHIIEELIVEKVENFDKINDAYELFKKDHQMAKLIEKTNSFIPEFLKFHGKNPLAILHQQLSEGIHELEDEICLEKAQSIDYLFNYIISQLNMEKNEITKYKKILKSLIG